MRLLGDVGSFFLNVQRLITSDTIEALAIALNNVGKRTIFTYHRAASVYKRN
jgi:hypothetical protein